MSDSGLKITLVQSRIHWHDSAANLAMFGEQLDACRDLGHLAVLPETFASGFTQQPATQGQPMDGEAVTWLKETSRRLGIAITGSLAITEDGQHFNRMLFVDRGEILATYDKVHLFTLAGEHKRYQAGQRRVVFDFRGWRICPQVCYDLRFPVFSRCRNDYDLLLYVANWPTPRANAWIQLLRARAIENLCYTIGVNRVGEDGNGWDYAGASAAVDYLGKDLVDLAQDQATATVTLSLDDQQRFRQKFDFLADADDFELKGIES
ncbi:MAG: amidohydrolase [Pseudomonadota bacterium]